MQKKYNPEQTKEKIISISTALFVEKGYDKTSMQDIVNALGMSKGAIFHHFKSKEDIFDAALTNIANEQMAAYKNLLANEMKNLNARDKITQIIQISMGDSGDNDNELSKILTGRANDPKIILGIMKFNMEKSAPLLADLLREGIIDGSISTTSPDENAEVLLLLLNLWCEPMIFECDVKRFRKRLEHFQFLMKISGIDVVSNELIDNIIEMHRKYLR